MAGQQQSNWCWAASGQMTMNFIHPASAVVQGDEANKRLGRTDCTNSSVPAACNQTGWPEFEKYDFETARTDDAALSWADLRSEIGCYKRPYAFSWHWSGGGGHMMVVRGYMTLFDYQYVLVNNPLPVNQGEFEVITYERYVDGPNTGDSHWDDFHRIKYVGD
jgi:hypothetical protein